MGARQLLVETRRLEDLRALPRKPVDASEQLRGVVWTLPVERQHAKAIQRIESLGIDLAAVFKPGSNSRSQARSQALGLRVGAGIDQPDERLRAGLGEERRGHAVSGRGPLQGFDLARRPLRLGRRERHRQMLAALGHERFGLAVAEPERVLTSLQESARRHGRRETGGGPVWTSEAVELQDSREKEGARQVEREGPAGFQVRCLQVEPKAFAVDPRQPDTARCRLFVKAGVDALLEVAVGETTGEGGGRGNARRPVREVAAQEGALRGRIGRPQPFERYG